MEIAALIGQGRLGQADRLAELDAALPLTGPSAALVAPPGCVATWPVQPGPARRGRGVPDRLARRA